MPDPDLLDEISRLAKAYEEEYVDFRRALHRRPELGGQEYRTTEAVVQRLRAAGLQPQTMPGGTGVVCDIRGIDGVDGEPPTVGLRADLDALPVQDLKQVSYRSTVDGVCHACGHDAHTAILLGTALVLAELHDAGRLTRSVRCLFQPAEEVPDAGASDVVAAGLLEGLREVYALHCDPQRDVGTVGLRSGPITAAADLVRATVRGPGGHTARPYRTADVVYALAAVTSDLPAVLSRLADPRAGLSLVWGQIHAGRSPNAIPAEGYVEGTLRCLDPAVWEAFRDRVPALVREVAAPYGVDVDSETQTIAPPCVNDVAATHRLRDAVVATLGESAVGVAGQSLGGEDFAWMTSAVPGSLARLGVRGPKVDDAGDLHQGTFDIDESALDVGVRLLCTTIAVSETG